MNEFPYIFTFYSFKGGVGRSMAVLNVAYALAGRGRHVLILDMDLEAPGISGFLQRHQELDPGGPGDILDLLAWAIADAREDTAASNGRTGVASSHPPLSDYTAPVRPACLDVAALRPRLGTVGRVDVVPMHTDRDYFARLEDLGIHRLSRQDLLGTGRSLRMSLKAWRFERNSPHYHGPAAAGRVPYDYVLIDSRTGITEIGGLCIGPLSDRLVVLSPLNDQGIEMTRRFLEEVGITGVQEPTDARWDAADVAAPSPRTPRLGPKPTLLVASLLPLGEIDAKRQRLQRLETAIGPVAARLSYHPQLALLESVFVRDYPEEGLATEYRALADQVMAIVNDHAVQLAALSQRYWSEEGSRELAATALLRLTPHQPDLGEALLRNLAPTWTPRTDAEFIAADQMFRLLTQPEAADRPIGFDLWGRLLTEWGTQTTDPSLRSRRLQEALAHFSTVGNLEEASPEQRSLALFNRGVAQERFGNSAAAIEDYTASATVPGTSPSRKAKAVVARGLAKGHRMTL